MKRWKLILTNNWQAKLASLAAASLIWIFIKHNITYSQPSSHSQPSSAPPSSSAPQPMPPND